MFGIIIFAVLTVPVLMLASTIEQIFTSDDVREMGVDLGQPQK